VYAAVKFVGIVKASVTVRGDQGFLARSGILTALSPKSRLCVGREFPIVANDRARSPNCLTLKLNATRTFTRRELHTQ